jgi:hypothetical protein
VELNVELSLPIFRLALAVFIPWRGADGIRPARGMAPALMVCWFEGGAVELPGRSRPAPGVSTFAGVEFAFVSALYGPGMDPKGKFPLIITNPGDKPLYDVKILIFQAMDFPANGRTISLGTLYPFPSDFMRRLNLEVPLDGYNITINTKATPEGFSEHLYLTQENGTIHQSYYVCRPPHGYVCRKEERLMAPRLTAQARQGRQFSGPMAIAR